MARSSARFGAVRTTTSNDSTDPAAPCNAQGVPNAAVAGVLDLDGMDTLIIDADGSAGGNGAVTMQPVAFNAAAQKWFTVGATVAITAGQQKRFTVSNWGSRWAYVELSSIANTVSIWLGGIVQEGY